MILAAAATVFVPRREFSLIWGARRLQDSLPIANINPLIELEPHLLKVRDLLKSKLLVEGDARVVWQCNAANHSVSAQSMKDREEFAVEH